MDTMESSALGRILNFNSYTPSNSRKLSNWKEPLGTPCSTECTFNSTHITQQSIKESPHRPPPEPQSAEPPDPCCSLDIQADYSYLTQALDTRVSSLTKCLESTYSVGEQVTVYLSSTEDSVSIPLDHVETLNDLLETAVFAYRRGTDPKSFSLWVCRENSSCANTDMCLDLSLLLKDLKYSNFVLLENSDQTILTESIRVWVASTPIDIKKCRVSSLDDLLLLINELLPSDYRNPSDFEFKVRLSSKSLTSFDECHVAMNFPVSQLQTNELVLVQKCFADSPSFAPTPTRPQHSKFPPKEYQITAYSKRGKPRKLTLGIDGFKLSLTSKQGVFKKHKPARSIAFPQVKAATHEPLDSCVFYLEYSEDSAMKWRKFSTASPSTTSAIVSTISRYSQK